MSSDYYAEKYTTPRTTSCTTPGNPTGNRQGTTLGVKWLSKKRSVWGDEFYESSPKWTVFRLDSPTKLDDLWRTGGHIKLDGDNRSVQLWYFTVQSDT